MMGMSMSVSYSLSQSMRQEQRQEQRMTQAQRLLVVDHLHGLVIALAGAIREERYQPEANCFKCGHKMMPAEILRGFLEVETDFTTECPKCWYRFEPKLICFGIASRLVIPYFCPTQVLGRLRDVATKAPEVIAREMPGEYRSAVIHHGTLRGAFKLIGVDYTFPEILGWESKIQPFLGRLPDTAVARSVGVGVAVIRRQRTKAGIAAFTRSKALDAAQAAV